MIALPTYVVRFSIGGIPTTLFEVVLLAALAFTLGHAMRSREEFRPYMPLALWGALLTFIGVSSLLVAPDTRAAAGLLKAYLIEPVLFGLAASYAIKTRDDVMLLLKALTIPALVISVIALVQYATGWGIPAPWTEWAGRRATGVYGSPNAVGLFLAPLVSAFFAVAIHGKAAQRWFGVVAALGVAAILAAHADGALVAVGASVVVVLFWTRARKAALLLAGAALVCALIVPASRQVLLFQDTSGQVHIALWQGTVRLLQEAPLTGAGLSGFPAAYDTHRNAAHTELLQYPHNVVLNFWSELGLTGAIWIVATLGGLAVIALRLTVRDKKMGVLIASVTTAFSVYGLVDVPYFKNDLAILFWLWLAVAFTVYTIGVRER